MQNGCPLPILLLFSSLLRCEGGKGLPAPGSGASQACACLFGQDCVPGHGSARCQRGHHPVEPGSDLKPRVPFLLQCTAATTSWTAA